MIQDQEPASNLLMITPAVAWVAIMTYLSVAVWARQKRLEREAFYRTELYRALVEKGQMTVDQLLRMREEDRLVRLAAQRGSLWLAGLITGGLGLGLLYALSDQSEPSARGVGAIPLALGLAILAYVWFVHGRITAVPRSPVHPPSD